MFLKCKTLFKKIMRLYSLSNYHKSFFDKFNSFSIIKVSELEGWSDMMRLIKLIALILVLSHLLAITYHVNLNKNLFIIRISWTYNRQ